MRDSFLMFPSEAVPNGWAMEGYCKAGGFTSRFFIIEAVFWKSLVDIIDLPHEIYEGKFVDLFHI